MSTRVRYEPNETAFGTFIMSEQMMKPVMSVARHLKRSMRARSPRSGDTRDKAYADSFEIRAIPLGVPAGKKRRRRVAARIVNTAEHAPALEFGLHEGTPAQTQRRRIMLSTGMLFGDVKGQGDVDGLPPIRDHLGTGGWTGYGQEVGE